MAESNIDIESLQNRILGLEAQLSQLRRELALAQRPASALPDRNNHVHCPTTLAKDTLAGEQTQPLHHWQWPLEASEYRRYGRQLIMPEIGLRGQLNLKQASILVVGLGGLGCPASAYLAGAGVGTIGLVDGDIVETSNLHRQILHSVDKVGVSKVNSATESLSRLNPQVKYVTYPEHLSPATALSIIETYDLILDCTDHPTSRYLVSDAAVLAGKPLVSASALRTEGQLMVLNNPPSTQDGLEGGPCYRCVFPNPPPAETITTCGEGGILGPVVGVMGVLMALEAIKIMTSKSRISNTSRKDAKNEPSTETASMLLFSAYSSPSFRTVRLRGKRKRCAACSSQPTISKDSLTSGSLDYATFCGVNPPVRVLRPDERVDAKSFSIAQKQDKNDRLVIDVREKTQYDICHLDGSINIPFSEIESSLPSLAPAPDSLRSNTLSSLVYDPSKGDPIYVLCRFGNDSQLAVRKLKEAGFDNNGKRWIGDVQGGLRAWKQDVDPTWPEY